MTRTIRCEKCAGREQHELADLPPGEGVRLVRGRARAAMLCDRCNAAIARGEARVAATFFTLGRPFPDWEAEFLHQSPRPVQAASHGPGPAYHVVIAEFPDGSAAAKVRELPDFLMTGDHLESLLEQIDDAVTMHVRASAGPDDHDLAFERVTPDAFGPPPSPAMTRTIDRR